MKMKKFIYIQKERRSVPARMNINVRAVAPSKPESVLFRFYVYTDHLFSLNHHCKEQPSKALVKGVHAQSQGLGRLSAAPL